MPTQAPSYPPSPNLLPRPYPSLIPGGSSFAVHPYRGRSKHAPARRRGVSRLGDFNAHGPDAPTGGGKKKGGGGAEGRRAVTFPVPFSLTICLCIPAPASSSPTPPSPSFAPESVTCVNVCLDRFLRQFLCLRTESE